jgi:hypothetical protein
MPALPPRPPVPGYGAPPFPPQAQRPAAFMPVPRPPQFLPHMFPASLPAQKHGGFLQGLLFGVILVAIAIAWFFLANFFTGLFFISLNISFSAISIFTTVIALIHIIIINGIVYFCAGIFGAKRTGRVSGGVMTSLWSCLWFIIGTIVIEVIAAALTIADLSKRFPAESTNFAQEIILTNLFWLVIFFIISVGVSAGLGALGGLIGRDSAHKHQPPMMPPMPQPLPPSAPQR